MSRGVLARFYRSKRWHRCRDAFMQERNFVCERCGAPASICHHRRYLTERNYSDPDVSLNPDNLEALCMACHDDEHNVTGATVDGVTFDQDGNLVKTF